MGRKKRISLKDKRKKVKVRLIQRLYDGKLTMPYKILDDIISKYRNDLSDVKIALAFNNGWRADADGLLTLGKCSKRKDLDRELDEFDFIISLNENAWPGLSDENKERLIFHELCHAQLCYDKNNQPMIDDRGRIVCRIRKHDFEDFSEVIKKYGFKESMSQIAKQATAAAEQPLIDEIEKTQKKKETGANQEFEPDPEPNENGVFESPNEIEVKLPKSYRTKIVLLWVRYKGKFYTGFYMIQSGFGTTRPVQASDIAFNSFSDALYSFLSHESFIIKALNKTPPNYKYKKQIKAAISKTVKDYLKDANGMMVYYNVINKTVKDCLKDR